MGTGVYMPSLPHEDEVEMKNLGEISGVLVEEDVS
jgi:hypothetical protein